MKDKERDNFDDLFRSGLYDYEADTSPEDWEAIVERLPKAKPFFLRPNFRYWAAAAVLALIVSLGVGYRFDNQRELMSDLLVKKDSHGKENFVRSSDSGTSEVVPSKEMLGMKVDVPEKNSKKILEAPRKERILLAVAPDVQVEWVDASQETSDISIRQVPVSRQASRAATVVPGDSYAIHSYVSSGSEGREESSRRKWQVGLASGSLSFNSDNLVNRYVTNSDALRSESLLALNAVSENGEQSKTNIHHRIPFNLGLSVSHYLTPRLAVQFGLSYAYLASDWKTNGIYHTKTERRLHFVGIPVSLSYTIAEWNKVRCYVLAGAKTEVNVAGRQEMRVFSDDNVIALDEEKVRMKEWQWSVNAGVGVSYPLVRFMSLFGEVGGAYYIDNGSSMETVYAEKPFNLNLQVGLRFGF